MKNWSLPLGIMTGVIIYFCFHFIPWLDPLKPLANTVSGHLIPALLFVMLFITFCKVSPKDMKLRKWHVWLALFQIVSCIAIAVPLHFYPDFAYAELAEGAMVCIICPTATAAAVITGKLGGSETSLTTYTILSNLVAALVIPAVFPLVEAHEHLSFLGQFAMILRKVFPLLIFPFIAALILRRFFPKAHAAVVKYCGNLAFYLWAFSLIMVIGQALRSLVNSDVSAHVKWLLAAVGLAVCVVQFILGKSVGGHYGERISAGQGLGQKNTVFAIWAAVTYLSPVVSIAPSSYILWQNLINSWQLWKKRKKSSKIK